jgi:hypothetical protein
MVGRRKYRKIILHRLAIYQHCEHINLEVVIETVCGRDAQSLSECINRVS